MSTKGFALWSFVTIFLMIMSAMLTSTILNTKTATVAVTEADDKIISQSAQQNLSELIFQNDELTSALTREQTKSLQLENQVVNLTTLCKEFEGYCDTQTLILEADAMLERGDYEESLERIKTIGDAPMSENTKEVCNRITAALQKKGYK